MRLSGYAMWFDHIEVNATYYGTPSQEAVAQWVSATPPSFQFDIRLHQALSRSPEKAGKDGRLWEYQRGNLEPLFQAKRFGTFLLVLSPTFSPEGHRLQELDALIRKIRPHRLAIELRHAGWVAGRNRRSTLSYFRDQGVVWVAMDMPRIQGSNLMPSVDEVTQPQLAYLRLHGRNRDYLQAQSAAERHAYEYTNFELRHIVKRVRALAAKAGDVRVVANNHADDYAPRTALILKQLLGE